MVSSEFSTEESRELGKRLLVQLNGKPRDGNCCFYKKRDDIFFFPLWQGF